MLKKLKIRNFESHKETIISFHPGVNFILGESDEGKSGIIRALTWNAQNRPMGFGFRNDQLDPKKDKKENTEVSVEYDSGTVARRRNATSTNEYQIDEQESLRALKTDVPDEVQDISRMKQSNIQGQHPTEQYFLLAEKPGYVAKKLNDVAGLSIMDKAKDSINSQVRENNAKIKIIEREIESLKESIKNTDWIPKAQEMARKIERLRGVLELDAKKIYKINDNIGDVNRITKELEAFLFLEPAKAQLKSLENAQLQKLELKEKAISIQRIVSDMISCDSELDEYKDIEEAKTSMKQLLIVWNERHDLQQKMGDIEELLDNIGFAEEMLTDSLAYFDKTLRVFNRLKENTECPVCGRKGNA